MVYKRSKHISLKFTRLDELELLHFGTYTHTHMYVWEIDIDIQFKGPSAYIRMACPTNKYIT